MSYCKLFIHFLKIYSMQSKSNTSHHGLTAYSSANSERPHENQNQSHDSKGRRHSSHSSMHRHNHHHHHHHHETEKKEAGFSQDRAQRSCLCYFGWLIKNACHRLLCFTHYISYWNIKEVDRHSIRSLLFANLLVLILENV